ncbi:THO complex subunit 6 homolog [Coccinella septempunctata]|uniref:THO complex subunit 6 homolog n=1 Tax=Coccinella septempunctata TaxID=41139 RepID=UPI001D06D122|nr:THO complex subunit 6 homolog [Coccinella septempunctata]
MTNYHLKKFYNTILCQAFSPCGNYFVAGDIYGKISVFHLSKLINPDVKLSKDEQFPKCTFEVCPNMQINSLLSTETYLIVGAVGEIKAYLWKNIKTSKNVSCAWSIDIPNDKGGLDKPDVNSLYFLHERDLLLAGCGDNNIYAFQIETRKPVKTLSGHSDYVHCLCGLGNDLISGSEDGSVCIWDIRENKKRNQIHPYMNDEINRPDLGKWIGAVGYNEDFLICGGGPRLSLWHFRSLNHSTIFPIEDKGIHVAEIYQDKVFAGGRSEYFYQLSFNGNIIAEIPTSGVTTYSMIHQEEPYKALCIAGSSPKIDVCSNFVYRDLVLTV